MPAQRHAFPCCRTVVLREELAKLHSDFMGVAGVYVQLMRHMPGPLSPGRICEVGVFLQVLEAEHSQQESARVNSRSSRRTLGVLKSPKPPSEARGDALGLAACHLGGAHDREGRHPLGGLMPGKVRLRDFGPEARRQSCSARSWGAALCS